MSMMISEDEVSEIMVISDAKSTNVNCSIYDLKHGNLISSYKEGHSVPKGLSFIGDDYLIAGCKETPCMKVWTVSNNVKEDCTMVSPGKVNCLAVTYCGAYCAAGIDKCVYLWEVGTGKLLNILHYHSQPVTCVRFTSDGSYLISGGKDGLVYVWMLSKIVNMSDENDPYYTWMDHSSAITDIFVGKLDIFSRVVTTSQDMSCKIYELDTGSLLTTICTEYEITAVTMDECEFFLLLGSINGDIYRINLFASRDGEVKHSNSDSNCAFIGHKKAITCLSLSSMGNYLLSGSEDQYCRVWDMSNFTCVRTMPFDGAITNAFFTLRPPCLKQDVKSYPSFYISTFKRAVDQDNDNNFVTTNILHKELTLFHTESPDYYFDASILKPSSEKFENICKTKVSIKELENINQQIYAYALCDVLTTNPMPSEKE